MLDKQAEKDMKLFRLIGQERRFQVLLLLCDREMTHEDICLALGKPMGVYKHLKAMVDASLLIKTDITRRDVMYRANPKVLESLADRLTEMSIDAHEITYRAAQKGTPLGDLSEKEYQERKRARVIKRRNDTFGEVYGRKIEDIISEADRAEIAKGMAKIVPGAKYDMFEGISDEAIARTMEPDWAEGDGPDDG